MAKKSSTSKRKDTKQFTDLLEVLKKKVDVDIVINNWIDRYHRDAEEAVYELLSLVIDISGGDRDEMTFEDFQDKDIKKAAQPIYQQSDSNETYPLLNKRTKYLYEQFEEFWENIIIKSSSAGILYDNYFLEMLVLWLDQLGVASKRGLRHTTTLVCIHIVYSLINVLKPLRDELGTVNKFHASSSQSSAKQTQLKTNQTQLTKNIKMIETMISDRIFKRILHYRFEDFLPDIRSICLMPLANWVLDYPSLMMTEDYTKYIGHALNDWIADVRLAAVQAVTHIYSEGSNYISQMDLFTQRYRHRIEEIAYSDKISSISVEAIKLVKIMANHELLEDVDVMKICKLYLVDNEEISMESGSLIYQQFLEDLETEINSTPKTNKKGQQLHFAKREEQFQTIIDFLDKSSIPSIPYYLVNSLWKNGYQIFIDWNFYHTYLADLENKDINESHLIILLKILKASVQIAIGDRFSIYSVDQIGVVPTTASVADLQKSKKDKSKTKSSIDESISSSITSQFIELFPNLLVQYKSNILVCEHLIDMAKYFTLDTYITMRLQSKFKELLEIIKEIFVLHPYSSSLINTISQSFYRLLGSSNVPSQLESESKAVIHEIFKVLITSLKSTSNQLTLIGNEGNVEGRAKEVEDLIFSLISDLGKLDSIGKLFHFDDEEYDGLLYILMKGIPNLQIDEEDQSKIIMQSSSCYSNLITWTLYQGYYVAAEKGEIIPPLNDKLLTMFYMFSDYMIRLIDNPSPQIQLFAYKLFIDTRLPFSPAISQTCLHMYDIDLPIQETLKVCGKNLLLKENNYNLIFMKQKFLRELLEKIEKTKQNKKIRKRFFGKKKKTSSSTKTSSTSKKSDGETTDGKSDGDTSMSEKETTDHDTTGTSVSSDSESDSTKKNRSLIATDLDENFEEDINSESRVDDILITMMHSIQVSFVTPRLLIEVLKQIAFVPSEKSMNLIKEFVSFYKLPDDESESSIIVKALVRFHKLCISKEVSSNSAFQTHMFTRLNALAKWLITEAINNDSLGKIIMKSIRFIQHNPNISKGREFISVIEYMATKLSNAEDINMVLNDRTQVIFDKRHKYLPFIEKLYNFIINLQNELEDNDSNKKKKKTQPKRQVSKKPGAKPKPSTTTSTTKISDDPQPPKKKPTRRRRKPTKYSSSEEEESESSEESDQEPPQHHTEEEDDDEMLIDPRSTKNSKQRMEIEKESSESSEDFEPSPMPTKKRKSNK